MPSFQKDSSQVHEEKFLICKTGENFYSVLVKSRGRNSETKKRKKMKGLLSFKIFILWAVLGFELARQVFYHLSHASSPFSFQLFFR
jgi:hypothetical protein